MSREPPTPVRAFYRYGYNGRDMFAIFSPYAMPADAAQIVGRDLRIGERIFRVKAVARQVSGPIHEGEPIGVEIEDVTDAESVKTEPPPQ